MCRSLQISNWPITMHMPASIKCTMGRCLDCRKGKPVWRPFPCSHAPTITNIPLSDWPWQREHGVGHPTSGHARFHVAPRYFWPTGEHAAGCHFSGASRCSYLGGETLASQPGNGSPIHCPRSTVETEHLARKAAYVRQSGPRFSDTRESILKAVIARGEHNMALFTP